MSLPLHLAIGAFDGVHLGHRAVLHSARDAARADGGIVGVLTYDPHPSKVLRPESSVPLIFTRAQKDERLTEAGAQLVHHEKFDRAHASIEAADFPKWLKQTFPHLKSLHVGSNFQYGRGRAGNGETLIAHGLSEGLSVKLVEAVHLGDETVSSSRIRQCLVTGELDLANAMLLRPYEAEGTIIGGRRLGRTIGFPTVNVAWEPELKPAYGVYAVEVIFKGETDSNRIRHVIGGPDGLHPSILDAAQEQWSFGRITLPHPLVRVILSEQLYRAWSIQAGHPYHRGN